MYPTVSYLDNKLADWDSLFDNFSERLWAIYCLSKVKTWMHWCMYRNQFIGSFSKRYKQSNL